MNRLEKINTSSARFLLQVPNTEAVKGLEEIRIYTRHRLTIANSVCCWKKKQNKAKVIVMPSAFPGCASAALESCRPWLDYVLKQSIILPVKGELISHLNTI